MKKYIQRQSFVNNVVQIVTVLAIAPLLLTRFSVIEAITRPKVEVESVFIPHAVSHTPRTNTAPIIELTAVAVDDKEETEEPVVEQLETQASVQEVEGVQEVPASTQTSASVSVSDTSATQVQSTPAATTPAQSTSAEAEAKEFIAQKESGGSYTAQNGRFYGRYQLDLSYLNGDLSPENQERVADAYVAGRYGSWVAAKEFWLGHNWY